MSPLNIFYNDCIAGKDLHSGIYGGSVHEAMTDLVFLMNSLVDQNGKILVDGLYNEVAPLIGIS